MWSRLRLRQFFRNPAIASFRRFWGSFPLRLILYSWSTLAGINLDTFPNLLYFYEPSTGAPFNRVKNRWVRRMFASFSWQPTTNFTAMVVYGGDFTVAGISTQYMAFFTPLYAGLAPKFNIRSVLPIYSDIVYSRAAPCTDVNLEPCGALRPSNCA